MSPSARDVEVKMIELELSFNLLIVGVGLLMAIFIIGLALS